MIAFLRGRVAEKKPAEVIVDVNGVGYRAFIPTSTYERLPAVGEEVHLLTHHHVREDAENLFGFMTAAERTAFETMLGVTGVGPKLALAALSAMSPTDLRRHVVAGEIAFLTGIPGVGRKTAERMIVELRDRFAALDGLSDLGTAGSATTPGDSAARADALAALEQLGFTRAAGEKALRSVLKKYPDAVTADELVRRALREQ
ncbi:MAG TPA: Holliday junction branch migration protein RuvA [Rhodothermales bacterium]